MQRKKFPIPLLIIAVVLSIATIYSIFSFPPSYTVTLWLLSIPLLPFVLLGLGLSIFATITFFTRSILHGLLIGSVSIVYLLLRLTGLTSVFFVILLLAICVAIELFFVKKT
jgi:hypothetical protein